MLLKDFSWKNLVLQKLNALYVKTTVTPACTLKPLKKKTNQFVLIVNKTTLLTQEEKLNSNTANLLTVNVLNVIITATNVELTVNVYLINVLMELTTTQKLKNVSYVKEKTLLDVLVKIK